MRILLPGLLAVLWLEVGSGAAGEIEAEYRGEVDRAVTDWLEENLAGLVATYKTLHANPELSLEEHETAVFLAGELKRAGYAVTSNVGGNGVVGVLKNGPGPTVLIRTELDALPVTEETGLDYASKVTAPGPGGQAVGVMHACGHDVHMTMLIGTARLLSELRERWSGTVVLIGQPAEEIGQGARMMIADGLFERFGRPDYCLALHVKHDLPADTVGCVSGWAFANVDSVDVVVYGRGGHGAQPHQTADPIVAAAHLVANLQTLVSRRLDPTEAGVVTVGSIHGGSKHNVIPDQVRLQLTVRSYTDEVRGQLLEGIRQVATDTCRTFGCPRAPTVVVLDEYTPASYNDPALTAAAVGVFERALGEKNVVKLKPEMIGEDFGVFARHLKVPGLQFRTGAVSRDAIEASRRPNGPALPPLHSSKFAPLPEPTLRTSVRTMVNLAVSLLESR